ncbi:MAG: phosphoglucomutase [Roseiflexaceae bacterium]|nr:phosphoglucomutase [Roseiflexaceae bacterium]
MGHRPQLQYHRWEGVYTADVTLNGVRQRVASLVAQMTGHGWTCIVAADTRFMASQIAIDVYQTLSASGVTTLFCPMPAPLPAIERAIEQRRADCAIIVSAGNRPFWYCGLIALTPALDQPPFALPLPPADQVRPFPPASDPPEHSHIDVRALYLEALRTSADIDFIRRTSQTLFVDPMNGTTSGYIPAVLGEGGQTKAIEINREIDPLFTRQTPHPLEANLARLRKLVRASDSHLGMALSADGRALGVVDNQGDLLTPIDLALVIGQHLSRQYRQRGFVVVPPGGEGLAGGVRAWEENFGLKIEQIEGATVRVAELVERERSNLVVGITATGEVTLGRSVGIPDALVAALVLIEAVARSGLKLRPLLNSLRGK